MEPEAIPANPIEIRLQRIKTQKKDSGDDEDRDPSLSRLSSLERGPSGFSG